MIAALLAFACAAQQPEPLPDGVAVAWTGREIREDDFARWLTGALGRGHDAVQAALTHLLQIRLVESEAAARGWTASAAAVDARYEQARAALEAEGFRLDQELRARGLSEEQFRKLLGDSILHERLVRAELGLADDQPVDNGQLQAWSDARIAAALAAPPPDGPELVLLSGVHRVTRAELGGVLVQTLAAERLRELARQLALERALPEWGAARGLELPDALLLEEIEWRRRRVAENPNYQGATYEGLLAARGMTLEQVLAGVELRVAGWLHLYAQQLWSDEWFAALPPEQAQALQDEHGATRELSWLMLHAAPQKQSELDLDLEEAAAQLREWSSGVRDGKDFAELAGKYSEHETSRRRGGSFGFVHRSEPGVDPLLTGAAFAAPIGALHGPVTVQGGLALLWIGSERPAPSAPELWAAFRRARRADAEESFLDELGLRTRWDPR